LIEVRIILGLDKPAATTTTTLTKNFSYKYTNRSLMEMNGVDIDAFTYIQGNYSEKAIAKKKFFNLKRNSVLPFLSFLLKLMIRLKKKT
jgi:hypothetical protein